jgi:hypothetical protein
MSRQRRTYADLLCRTLNAWAEGGPFRVNARATVSRNLDLGILTLTKSKKAMGYEETYASSECNAVLDRIWKALRESRGRFSSLRNLKVFDSEEPKIHIVKPLVLFYWTRTAALYDAHEIAASILSNNKTLEGAG